MPDTVAISQLKNHFSLAQFILVSQERHKRLTLDFDAFFWLLRANVFPFPTRILVLRQFFHARRNTDEGSKSVGGSCCRGFHIETDHGAHKGGPDLLERHSWDTVVPHGQVHKARNADWGACESKQVCVSACGLLCEEILIMPLSHSKCKFMWTFVRKCFNHAFIA